MDDKSKAREEYEIQLYGFPISELRSAQREMIESHVNSLVADLNASLIAAAPPTTSPAAIAKCHDLAPKITTSIMDGASEVLNKLDQLIVNTFSIPDNIVLPENQLLVKNPSTAKEEDELQHEFEELTKICKQNGHLMTTFDAELQVHDEHQSSVEKELAIMDQVDALLATNIDDCDASQLMEALKQVAHNTIDQRDG